MDKRHQETFHQIVYRDGKYAHEKVSQQKNAHENHNDVSPKTKNSDITKCQKTM